jgi:hypothetical protein
MIDFIISTCERLDAFDCAFISSLLHTEIRWYATHLITLISSFFFVSSSFVAFLTCGFLFVFSQISPVLCFSMEMSAFFAAVGLFCSWWIYARTCNTALASGVFFFFTMEALQAVQYFFIAPDLNSPICDTPVNQWLTLAGYLHICLQPYFCHVINCSLTKSEKYIQQYRVVKKLCLIGGFWLFLRYFLAPFYTSPESAEMLAKFPSPEWLRGEKLCTFRGKWHLSWSVPMGDVSYYIPAASIHSFLMFAPFFAMYEKKGMVLQGIFLFAFGPYMASWISPSLMEQASIWCFFSIAQIAIMLFLIREQLLIGWSKGGSAERSLISKQEEKNAKANGNTRQTRSKKHE